MEFKVQVSEINDENLKKLREVSLKILRDSIKNGIPKDKIKLSKIFLDNNYEIELVVNELYDRMFNKYYNNNDSIFQKWQWIDTSWLPKNGTKDKLRELVELEKNIKTGYSCSKIRGSHNVNYCSS